MQKNITELYDNLEKNNISTQVAENRVSVLSSILSPANQEKLHRSLERMETEIAQMRKDLDKQIAMHNGSHKPNTAQVFPEATKPFFSRIHTFISMPHNQ